MNWMQSHRSRFSHSASIPQNCYQSLGGFASTVYSKSVLFVFNVTCDIWLGLSALFVGHCVEMNESFFQISYRDALCETIETPLRPLNWTPGYVCRHQEQGSLYKALTLDLTEILSYNYTNMCCCCWSCLKNFEIFLSSIANILIYYKPTSSSLASLSSILHLSDCFSIALSDEVEQIKPQCVTVQLQKSC